MDDVAPISNDGPHFLSVWPPYIAIIRAEGPPEPGSPIENFGTRLATLYEGHLSSSDFIPGFGAQSDQLSTSGVAEIRLTSIEIFIGAPIEYASERATLLRVCEYLSAQCIPAVILANVNLGGRQIDLVVGLDKGALVAESKEFTSPVRGSENGVWEVRVASGRWKEIRNAYTQTMAEAHALRDAMGRFAGKEVPYPNAALLFVPAIPAASRIPQGDYKVSIAGVDKVSALMSAI